MYDNPNNPVEAKILEEGVNDIAPSLKLDVEDNELLKLINRLVSESGNLYDLMKKIGDENERYYVGKQLEDEKLRRGSAKIIDNRMFMSAETIIPIMTSRTPEPTIRLKDAKLREKLKQMLMNLWEVPTDDDATEDMQANMEMISRHWFLYRLGLLKYEYDPDIDDIRTSVIRPNKVRVDPLGKNIDHCRFIAEYVDDTVDGLCDKWPKKKDEILQKVGKDMGGSKVSYIEFWTNEWCVYKFMDIILEKKKNPNFDYGDMGDGKTKFNIFKKPRKPYIALRVFNLGKSVYDDISLFEIGKTMQDAINRYKRNITDNAADNGVLCGSGDFIDKKVLESYTGAPDEKLFIKSGSVHDALQRLEPKQLAPFVYNDLQDCKSELDNLFSTHSTTRGERSTAKTLGEAQLLRQGDMGRIDLLSRALDRISQEWFQAMFQMYLVFKTEPLEINSNDEEGTSIIWDRNEYINPETNELYKVIIKVKPGSAMSIDKDERRAEAMELMKGGMIDPITFFTRMDYSNPQEMAKRLFMWQQNPVALFPDLMKQQQQQQLATAVNQPIPEGTPINLPNGGQAPVTQ